MDCGGLIVQAANAKDVGCHQGEVTLIRLLQKSSAYVALKMVYNWCFGSNVTLWLINDNKNRQCNAQQPKILS